MNFFIYIIVFLIIFLFIHQITFKDKKSYSINKFIWVYIFIFWGIIPLIQYLFNIISWEIQIDESAALLSYILILLWVVIYTLSYNLFSSRVKNNFSVEIIKPFFISYPGILIIILIQLIIFIFFFSQSGRIILIRGGVTKQLIGDNQSTHLLISHVLRALSVFASIFLLYNYKQNKTDNYLFFFFVSFALLLLTNFPLALPRYMAGAFYIAIIFIYKPVFKSKYLPVLALIFLFLIIYPIFSTFRFIKSLETLQISYTTLNAFSSPDFDNYTTLNLTLEYVNKYDITFGKQLLGVLLFFIPRSIWPNKPIGSGHLVAGSQGMGFTNLSCPIVAEGYINFGIIGVILFAFFIGYIAAKLDSRYYTFSGLNLIKIFYPVSLGMIFFVLRGDLMSSFAYTISFIFAALIMLILTKPFIRYKYDSPEC